MSAKNKYIFFFIGHAFILTHKKCEFYGSLVSKMVYCLNNLFILILDNKEFMC